MKMQDPELIAKTVRAVLHPFKNGVPLSELQGEYKSLTGDWIPFRHLGYGTLQGYLESIPGVVRMEGNKMGEVRISYSSEMAFVFAKCAWFITLVLPVPWISDISTVACMWCTNAGRSGSCGIDQVPLIFLASACGLGSYVYKRWKDAGHFPRNRSSDWKDSLCDCRALGLVSAFLTPGGYWRIVLGP